MFYLALLGILCLVAIAATVFVWLVEMLLDWLCASPRAAGALVRIADTHERVADALERIADALEADDDDEEEDEEEGK